MGPGKPKEKITGTHRNRSLGGMWIVGEAVGEMPGGGTAYTMLTLGFDPKQDRFVGTWVGSMMTHLWVYSGTLDGDGRTLTLDTEGPSFDDSGRLAKYRDAF